VTNVAISGLPAASALTGSELLPIVQSGTTSRTTIGAVSNLILGDYIDARNYAIDPTGGVDSSVGGNLAIIDAINQKKKLVWPSGLFKLNAPLLAFTNIQQSFQMYGQGGAAYPTDSGLPQNPVGHPYDSNTIFYTNYTNAPAIITNGGRFMVFKDFAILGQNVAPQTASTLSTGPSVSQSAYITSGCQNGRYAPYCAIAFDPFSSSTAQTISNITKATSAVVTVSTGTSNPFAIGQQVVFANVVGMTQINGLNGFVTSLGGAAGAWTATININSSAFSTYTSGGTAVGLPFNSGTISHISMASNAVVSLSDTSSLNPFQYGETIVFSGVAGMTQINGVSGMVIGTGGTGPGTWTVTVNVNSSAFSAYASGGRAVANDSYLSLAQYYQSAYAGDGTYGCVVENVNINYFTVGIAIGLSGQSAILGADLTFRNVNVLYCDVCYAIGQSQSRNLNIEYGNINNARTGIDGINYGKQGGTPPQMLRINFGNLYRIFALSQGVGNCVVENCYAESIMSLGQYGLSSASASNPLTFIGGDYSIGFSGWLQAPLLLETYGPTAFHGTNIGYVTEIDALNFFMPSVPVLFDHCLFTGTAVANTASHVGVSIDAGSGGYPRFVDCWINGGVFGGSSFMISNDMGRSFGFAKFTTTTGRLSAVFQTYRVPNGNLEYIFLPYSNQPSIAVFGVSSLTFTGSSVTFNCTNIAQLMVGDILFWSLLAQGYSLNRATVPALKIASIAGNSVTCSLLFDPAQYDTAANQLTTIEVWVAPNHWAPTQSLTCNTNGTTTLASVSPVTILQNGDFVAGTNIPANSRVVSGGGTGTVVISQPTTTTATGIALYFGRLNAPTLTPI
jgi:hypothetical protein